MSNLRKVAMQNAQACATRMLGEMEAEANRLAPDDGAEANAVSQLSLQYGAAILSALARSMLDLMPDQAREALEAEAMRVDVEMYRDARVKWRSLGLRKP